MESVATRVMANAISQLFRKYGSAIIGNKPIDIQIQFNDITNTIQKSEQRLADHVGELVDKAAYRQCVNKITAWAESLEREIKHTTEDRASDGWARLAQKFYDNSDHDGVNTTLVDVDGILTENAIAGTSGLLRAHINSLHTDLESNDRSKGIRWYLAQIDAFLGRAINIQLKGLILQMFMCTILENDKQYYIDYYETKMFERLKRQIQFTFRSMHPVVQQLKKDYVSHIDYAHWWMLRTEDKGVLHCQQGNDECIVDSDDWEPGNSWRFVEDGDDHYLYNGRNYTSLKGTLISRCTGPFQSRHKQHFRCTTRKVRLFEDRTYELSDRYIVPPTLDYSEYISMEQDPMKFKVAPIDGSDRFKLIPTSDWARGHNDWLFDTKWRLDDSDFEQFDQPAEPRLLTS